MNRSIALLILYYLLQSFYSKAFSQDKTLEYYLGAAKKNSPLLKDYYNQSQINSIDSLRINASTKPQVNAVSNNSYAPVIGGWGYDNAVTNGANLSGLITITKPLIRKDNLQNQYEALRLQNQYLQLTGKVTEQDIQKSITTQYITAYGTWMQYSFNIEILTLLINEDAILKKLTETGVYRQTDYLTFLVTLQQQQLLISQIRAQYQNDFATLNYISGIEDTSFETLAVPELELNAIPGIGNTVFYQQFITDSLLLKNKDTQIDLSYKPTINLYGDAGYLSSLAITPYKNFGASVGVNITVPIYDGKQKKMLHDKNAIAQQTTANYKDYFTAQFHQQLAQLLQQLQLAQQLINQATEQLKYSRGLMEANRRLLVTGDVRMADYVLAINSYLTAKNIINQNTVNKLQLINQINYWNRK